MNLRWAGADVIGYAEAAAPSFRSHSPGQRRKQWLRVRIRNGQNRDFRNCRGVFDFQPLGVFRGSNSRCEGITRIEGHVRDAAALHSIRRAIGPGRECQALDKSVLMGVGVNQAANGAVFGCNLGLDAAPGVVVARDDDLPLHGNTQALELLVVLGDSVVDVDERSGHVAIDRVSVISGQLFGLLVRGGVLRKRRFLELGNELRAAFDKLNDAFFGRGKKNVKLFDVRIETELLEFCGDPFGVVLVSG